MCNKKWDDEKIGEALEPLIDEYGHIPSNKRLKELGFYALSKAIQRNGGFRTWSRLMGCDLLSEEWTVERVERELKQAIKKFGRMPTRLELDEIGQGKLAGAISRTKGFETWAVELNAEPKDGRVARGRHVEFALAVWLGKRGFDVERQSYTAHYDLLVNGWRVDVKSSLCHNYIKQGKDAVYTFEFHNRIEHLCDFYALCMIDDDWIIQRRFFVPAEECPKTGVSIYASKYSESKYLKYEDRVDLLK